MLAGLAAAAALGLGASPAFAQLGSTGPIDPNNGFPYWYGDADGTRLELCLNPTAAVTPEDAPNPGEPIPGGGYCLTPFELPEERPADLPADQDIRFPDFFPGEAFWWTGEAHIDPPANDPDGFGGLLVLAQEAAFANEEPKEGDQMSFGRIRIRLDGLVPGATYKVTHPYGVDEVVAEEDGTVFTTEDIGCFPTPIKSCNFEKAANGRIGPFLEWDPSVSPAPPAGHVGDPDVPHEVVGSPNNTNFFKVEQVRNGLGQPLPEPVLMGETDLFAVTGKLATLQVGAEAIGADRTETVFNDADQKVRLVSSDPEAQVFYTTDGSSPLDAEGNPIGQPYTAGQEISLNSDPNAAAGVKTTLKFASVKGDEESEVFSKTYEVDLLGPNVRFSEPAGKLEKPVVEISTNERARVYYTTDGSNPDPRTGDNPNRRSFVFDPAAEPNAENDVNVARSQTLRAIAVDLDAANNDAEVNWGRAKSAKYNVSNLKVGPINPQNGFPFWYEDRGGTRLDMCLNPIAAPEAGGGYCATPFEMPEDWVPADGVRFPDRFPGEAFWWTGEASMDTGADKGSADLILALEAAFLNEEPKASDRMVFGRIRIRIDNLVIGEEYKVTHPYGVDTYVAEDNGKGSGEINVTEDIGCMTPSAAEPCDFDEAGFSRVGPFLTLADKTLEPTDAPDGGRYLSDPVLDQDVVTGSPIMARANPNDPNSEMVPANFFRVEGPGIRAFADEGETDTLNRGGTGPNDPRYIQNDFFSITGKYSEFQAAASEASGFYNRPLEVTLGASEFNARLFYKLNGTPELDANGEPINGTQEFVAGQSIAIPATGETTLGYVATSAGKQTEVYTETYKMDTEAPVVAASPAGGTFTNEFPAVALNFSNAEPGKVKVFYTTDGSDPSDARNLARVRYDAAQPIMVRKDTTLKFWATDEAGNATQVLTETYDIVDTIAPDAPVLDLAAASDTGASDTDNTTNATALDFTGTAEPGSTVTLRAGTVQGTATAANDGSFAITLRGVAAGTHQVTATATDPSGNEGAVQTMQLTVDRTAPRVTAQLPAGTYPRAHTVTLTPSEDAAVYYTLGGAVDPAPGNPGTVQGRTVRIANARDTLRFIGVDTAGNQSQTFVAEYRIRNFAPAITNMSPTTAIRDRTPLIAATVNDQDSNLQEANVTLTLNGRNIPRAAFVYNATNNRLTYQVPARQPLAPGRYNVSVTARDVDGGTTTRNWSFRVQ